MQESQYYCALQHFILDNLKFGTIMSGIGKHNSQKIETK